MTSHVPQLDFYDHLEVLGEGAFGTVSVYRLKEDRMHDGDLPKVMAVKELNKTSVSNITELREAKVSSFDHKNIITCYGVEIKNDVTYIKMEVANCSLATFQKDIFGGAITNNEFLHLAVQMAEGLEYLHARDIAHRDIKPDNILVLWPEYIIDVKKALYCVTPKLCDFGLSRHVPEKAVTMSLVGTRSYLAPEVIAAYITNSKFRGNYKTVDIFCLGLVFHQLLFNALPENIQEAGQRQTLLKTSGASSVKEEFIGLLKLMLQKESDERISASCAVNMMKPWYNETGQQPKLLRPGKEADANTGQNSKSEPYVRLYKKSTKLGYDEFGPTWKYEVRQSPGVVFQSCEVPRAIVVKKLHAALRKVKLEAVESIMSVRQTNILKCYKPEIVGDYCYLKTELAKMNLNDLRAELGGTFTEEDFEVLAEQICRGLYYLHSLGVLHGRIKPQNILVMSDYAGVDTLQVCTLKIADHYFSHMDHRQTSSKYKAPGLSKLCEVGNLDSMKSMDIFSTGVVFFEMLTGLLPSAMENPSEAQVTRVNSSPVWMNDLDKLSCTLYMFITMLHWKYQQRIAFWTRSLKRWIQLGRVKPIATSAYMERLSGFDDLRALHRAAKEGNLNEAKWLINSGDDVDRVDKKGWTPLHYASRHGHEDVAQLLIQRGAEVNRVNNSGSEPLRWACKCGHVEIAALLLENGADKNKLNRKGERPIDVTSFRNRESFQQLFSNFPDVHTRRNAIL